MESTRTITTVCTVLELGPFKHLMEETAFSERNYYLKCLRMFAGYNFDFSTSGFYLVE